MPTATKEKQTSVVMNREIGLPPEIVSLLKAMGVPLPANVKEITTETVVDETARTITIPKTMTKLEASVELKKQYESEEQLIDMVAEFPEWQWKDVLIAVKKVTEETFGWMNAVASFFSNPTEIDIVTNLVNGRPTTEKGYLGEFKVTTWDQARADMGVNGKTGVAYMTINVKRKHNKEVTQYFDMIREHLKRHSIYKGKCIVVTRGVRGGVDFELIENKPSNKIILNDDQRNVIDTFVIDTLGEEAKRTYLFTGDYGNGKTEVAMQVGVEAVRRGISFFYLKDATLFDEVLNKLKQYSPAVLFVEDIDEITGTEDRDAAMNKILNTLDGVQTKGNSLTTIFTTNHIERINSALRRPGRIDLIVKFDNPDAKTMRKIYESYLSNLAGFENIDLDAVVARTPNSQGAVVAEIAKRMVKLHSRKNNLTTEQALGCVVSMDYHIQIMKEDPKPISKEKVFYDAFVDMVNDGCGN